MTHLPGLTSAPKLQPIEARLVMLSTGMRAPMGLKIYGPDLETIEQSGKAIEQALKEVPSVIPSSVFYDRAVGAPYLEIKLNRDNMARYGVNVEDLQEVLSAAVGGMVLTTTVEGRERFPVRLRYARELRDNPEALSMLLCSYGNRSASTVERTGRHRLYPRRPDDTKRKHLPGRLRYFRQNVREGRSRCRERSHPRIGSEDKRRGTDIGKRRIL